MLRTIVPLLILASTLSACTSSQLPIETPNPTNKIPDPTIGATNRANLLIAPTSAPPLPTRTPFVWDETYPTPTFSPTFTPLARLAPDTMPLLANISMMDDIHGWAIEIGGHILHTGDGATNWQDATPPQGAYAVEGFFALDSNTAWATPSGENCKETSSPRWLCSLQTQTYVWRTRDGGTTWETGDPICLVICDDYGFPNSEWVLPRSLRFIDSEHGWFLITNYFGMNQDHYRIYRTEDGGATWAFGTSSSVDDTSTGGARTVEPLDLQTVFFTTNELMGARDASNHLSYYSTRTGMGRWDWSNWVDIPLPTNPIDDPIWEKVRCGTESAKSLPPLVLDFVQECYTTLSDPQPHIHVHFHSGDAGRSWSYWQQTGDVDFIDATAGWQFTANSDSTFDLEQTKDGGLTWVKISTVDWEGSLNFINESLGWALVHQGGFVSVVKTEDGGKTWTVITRAEAPPTPTIAAQP